MRYVLLLLSTIVLVACTTSNSSLSGAALDSELSALSDSDKRLYCQWLRDVMLPADDTGSVATCSGTDASGDATSWDAYVPTVDDCITDANYIFACTVELAEACYSSLDSPACPDPTAQTSECAALDACFGALPPTNANCPNPGSETPGTCNCGGTWTPVDTEYSGSTCWYIGGTSPCADSSEPSVCY